MLISTMAFLLYSNVDDGERVQEIGVLFEPDRLGGTLAVLLLNVAMLTFGLLVELGVMPMAEGLLLGMLSFLCTFFVIFVAFTRHSNVIAIVLYLFVYTVWGLYGVAATLSPVRKNVAYNALDIVSKNFYGAFILGYTLAIL